jgi:NADPH-dependent 2,4-dienoyl-CoA reductase/sulfur reductase-like enzyme
MTIVVVGGSLSGLRAVEGLRAAGWDRGITVVSAENTMPYNRPPLSKELLWGEDSPEDLVFELSEATNDVVWKLGIPASSLNLDEKTLTLSDGEIIQFEGLVIATGVSSRRLNAPGPLEGRTVLRTLDDAVALKRKLQPGLKLVILGAGFIGCEVASTARRIGCEVDVVAMDKVAMQIPLGMMLGAEIQRRHVEEGVRFHMGVSISELKGAGKVESVVLTDGRELSADLVLETIGSVPNTSWLDGNNLDLTNGVLCDPYLRAGGTPGVVVVGDVARFSNPLFNSPAMRIEHWQTAIDTANYGARTLLYDLGLADDAPKPISLMPWFWSDQGETRLTSFGMLGLADRQEIIEGDLQSECAVGYFQGEIPVGVVLVGMKEKSARYKRWLQKARDSYNISEPVK